MHSKLLHLKVARLLLKSFLFLGVILTVMGMWSGSTLIGVCVLLTTVVGLFLFECWKSWQLKKFHESYQPGFNLVYTDKDGVPRSAFFVRMESEFGRVVLKETDSQGMEREYIIPISSFISHTVEMRMKGENQPIASTFS